MQVFAGHAGPVQCGEFTPDGASNQHVRLCEPQVSYHLVQVNG